jgi:PKD repeat protein
MRKLLAPVATIALAVAAACTVHQDSTPSSLSGPSEAAFSLKMQATPDSVIQDGIQTSTISVTAFGPDGSAVAKNVQLTVQGVGTLTPSTVTTPGTAVYRPPAATSTGPSVVTILGKIIGTTGDSANSVFGPLVSPQVLVTLRPPSAAPPAVGETPTAIITSITPTNPTAQATTLFSAVSSCPSFATAGGCASATSTITNYDWDFGDGSAHGSGVTTTHMYLLAKPYAVVLTVTNSQNRSSSVTTIVTVGAGVGPTALFTALPNPAGVGATVTLDGSPSTGSPTNFLYTITSPGAPPVVTQVGGSSPTQSFTPGVAGTWSITLTVMDATGRTNTSPAKQIVVQ